MSAGESPYDEEDLAARMASNWQAERDELEATECNPILITSYRTDSKKRELMDKLDDQFTAFIENTGLFSR